MAMAPIFLVHGQVNRSWEVLMESVKPDKAIVVTRMNSGNLEGKLLSITADSITLQWRGQSTVVQRPDVFRKAGTRARNALIGMAIGAGAGVAWGANLGQKHRALSVVVLGGLGVGVGAAAGSALPIGPPLYQLETPVPKAPPPARPD
jgi:hypothetical protein